MEFIDFAPLLGIPAVVKVLDAYKHLVTDRDLKAAGYTVGAWIVGVAVTFLITQSSVNLPVGNWADVVLIGIGIGSTASVTYDFATRGEYEIEVAETAEFDGFVETEPPSFDV